jgi:uncharacterized membrane protein
LKETRVRSIMKALSWRVIATACTWGVAWTVTGSWKVGASIGFIDCFLKLGAYYAHERGWQKVEWGREK